MENHSNKYLMIQSTLKEQCPNEDYVSLDKILATYRVLNRFEKQKHDEITQRINKKFEENNCDYRFQIRFTNRDAIYYVLTNDMKSLNYKAFVENGNIIIRCLYDGKIVYPYYGNLEASNLIRKELMELVRTNYFLGPTKYQDIPKIEGPEINFSDNKSFKYTIDINYNQIKVVISKKSVSIIYSTDSDDVSINIKNGDAKDYIKANINRLANHIFISINELPENIRDLFIDRNISRQKMR